MALPTCGTINTTGYADCGVNPYNPGPISHPRALTQPRTSLGFDSIHTSVLRIPNRAFRLRSPENRSFRCTVACLRRSAYLPLMQTHLRDPNSSTKLERTRGKHPETRWHFPFHARKKKEAVFRQGRAANQLHYWKDEKSIG